MLFYVNVQNKTKFQYTNQYGGKSLSTTKQVEVMVETKIQITFKKENQK